MKAVSIDDLLKDKLGKEQALKVKTAFDLRFYKQHEHDDIDQKHYEDIHKRCWENYARAYYDLRK